MWRGKERTVNLRVPALARNYMLQPTNGKMSSYFHTDKSRWHITVLFFLFFLFRLVPSLPTGGHLKDPCLDKREHL